MLPDGQASSSPRRSLAVDAECIRRGAAGCSSVLGRPTSATSWSCERATQHAPHNTRHTAALRQLPRRGGVEQVILSDAQACPTRMREAQVLSLPGLVRRSAAWSFGRAQLVLVEPVPDQRCPFFTAPPGPLRRVANLRALLDLPAALSRVQEATSGTTRVDVGPYPVAYVSRPESVRAVLDNRVAGIAERGRFFEEISRVIGAHSLVTCEGEEHRRLRRLLAPAFRPEQVAAYGTTMIAAAEGLETRWASGERVALGEEMARLTLEIAARALLGLEGVEELDAFMTVLEAGTSVFYRLVLPRRISDRLWRTRLSRANRRLFGAEARVDAFVAELLDKRVGERQVDAGPAPSGTAPSGTTAVPNLLDVLLAARDPLLGGADSPLQENELRDQVVTFLFAGHETTAQALTWVFVQLCAHPAVEEQLVDELDAVLGSRTVTPLDLPRLRTARAVVRETLRLFPPAWFSSREAVAPTTLDGCAIAKGTLVVTSALALHRDPSYWDEPERFDPSRWLGPSAPDGAAVAYLPFGHGRRNCIGSSFAMTELVLVLASIASRWKVRVRAPGRIEPRATVTLRPRWPVLADLEARR